MLENVSSAAVMIGLLWVKYNFECHMIHNIYYGVPDRNLGVLESIWQVKENQVLLYYHASVLGQYTLYKQKSNVFQLCINSKGRLLLL